MKPQALLTTKGKTRFMSTKQALELKTILNQLETYKAEDIVHLEVKELTELVEDIVICSGTSGTHLKSMAERLFAYCKAESNILPPKPQGEADSGWVLLDLGHIIVHLMLPEQRDFFQLEELWDWAKERPPEKAE